MFGKSASLGFMKCIITMVIRFLTIFSCILDCNLQLINKFLREYCFAIISRTFYLLCKICSSAVPLANCLLAILTFASMFYKTQVDEKISTNFAGSSEMFNLLAK